MARFRRVDQKPRLLIKPRKPVVFRSPWTPIQRCHDLTASDDVANLKPLFRRLDVTALFRLPESRLPHLADLRPGYLFLAVRRIGMLRRNQLDDYSR
ncbi:MAG: hypothetical protein GY768_01765 [Planctomycetaceae bacterium]|nr:hypothetical protein [Planctomycetaceae bacterium]